MSHSPEPLTASDCELRDWEDRWIGSARTPELTARIVVCVNALKDVPDPEAFVAAVKKVIDNGQHRYNEDCTR
jgi:hypothetical protein